MSEIELLKNSNTKLGHGVYAFSLPSILTCPGRGECESFCYAARLENFRTAYALYLDRVMAKVEDGSWVSQMHLELRLKQPRFVRLHVSGDFFNRKYIGQWIAIATLHPNTPFFGFTRSWNVPHLLPVLEVLRRLPNVVLYASVERQEIDDPRISSWPKALVIDGTKRPPDLEIPAKVCPETAWRIHSRVPRNTGQPGPVNCSVCQYCIVGKGNVLFPRH